MATVGISAFRDNTAIFDTLAKSWTVLAAELENFAAKTLPTVSEGDADRLTENPAIIAALDALGREAYGEFVVGWYTDRIQRAFKESISPRFWAHFAAFEALPEGVNPTSCRWAVRAIEAAVCESALAARESAQLLDFLVHGFRITTKSPVAISLQRSLHAVLFAHPPLPINDILHLYFMQKFTSFCKSVGGALEESIDQEMLDAEEGGDGGEPLAVGELIARMGALDMTSRAHEVFTELLYALIEKRIEDKAVGTHDAPVLAQLKEWLATAVAPWVTTVLGHAEDAAANQQLKDRLDYFLLETFGAARVREMFNIIIDYPDSVPALKDLKECLQKTDQHAFLVTSLRETFHNRLLHAGATTGNIIQTYVSTIKALRILDPSGVMLESVGGPVREYLRGREDTIRSIVNSLTNDAESELYQELGQGAEGPVAMGDDSDGEDFTKWEPDPINADPGGSSRARRTSDTISVLINIYGSAELFVNEYRSLLADRLLAIKNYDTTTELKNMELLKLRFGEASMVTADVMLKDLADSKRIHGNIKQKLAEGEQPDFPLNATIVSRLFWPNLRETDVKLPAELAKSFELYGKAYETLKAPRKLMWKPSLGTVEVELSFNDNRNMTMNVPPVVAAIIYCFQEKDTWSAAELAEKLGMTVENVRKRIVYWVSHSIIVETSRDVYQVQEEPAAADVSGSFEDDNGGGVGEAADDSLSPANLEMIRRLIFSSLNNRGQQSADMMFNSIKMMQAVMGFEVTMPQLKAFLDDLVRADEVEVVSGAYKLKK